HNSPAHKPANQQRRSPAPHPDGFHIGPPDREKKCLRQYIVTITWWCSGAGWAARLLHGTHALGD
ncbi:hypothetical protein OSJ20_15235, partial [Mycobacterium ulcerans]